MGEYLVTMKNKLYMVLWLGLLRGWINFLSVRKNIYIAIEYNTKLTLRKTNPTDWSWTDQCSPITETLNLALLAGRSLKHSSCTYTVSVWNIFEAHLLIRILFII